MLDPNFLTQSPFAVLTFVTAPGAPDERFKCSGTRHDQSQLNLCRKSQ
jgi:hypothetical protein